jgi:hypothetical protein
VREHERTSLVNKRLSDVQTCVTFEKWVVLTAQYESCENLDSLVVYYKSVSAKMKGRCTTLRLGSCAVRFCRAFFRDAQQLT